VFINEDLSMKNGPLLSPDTYRTFILPHLKRLVARFFKSAGVRWVVVDTDGNCDLVIPLFLEAGVDAIWPLERPRTWTRSRSAGKYGRDPAALGRGGQAGARQAPSPKSTATSARCSR
jgi:hypothetical protein